MSLSALKRDDVWQNLEAEVFDLVVIGGGISGAGVARDAASRGMRVAVIEASDFASGTSSRSSKLVHGGIRYLENLEFGLVFEALRERRNLFDIAPHLVHPLRFMLPIYKGARVGMFKLGLGMWLYDALSMFETPRMHERLNATETLERAPILDGRDLNGSFVYSDAYMDDDRVVIETLRSAVFYGAQVINFAKVDEPHFEHGRLAAVTVTDQRQGRRGTVRGRHFVSTVGPWTDRVGQSLLKDWKPVMRPTKGVHLTFSRDRFPLQEAVVMISDDEKRIVFGIPRHEMVIVGTTDTDFQGDPATVRTDRADVDYLLGVINQYFPGVGIQETDIIASYSGVRPLVHDGSESESKTSREHTILSDPRNITFLMGGKYTTYRSMAEETVEIALRNFSGDESVKWSAPKTLEPLNPLATEFTLRRAKSQVDHWCQVYNLTAQEFLRLVERHGDEAFVILDQYLHRLPAGVRSAQDGGRLWALEAFHSIHETACFNLIDFFLRRTPLMLSEPDHGRRFLDPVEEIFALELGWSEAERKNQRQGLINYVDHEMAWSNA
jgi:glycerol-3-phosphate dehydrogenase